MAGCDSARGKKNFLQRAAFASVKLSGEFSDELSRRGHGVSDGAYRIPSLIDAGVTATVGVHITTHRLWRKTEIILFTRLQVGAGKAIGAAITVRRVRQAGTLETRRGFGNQV